ncbi:hypothetical protein [Sphaerisporangium fuscum]|uniref:hypothetical protein n=1 Tax=Sphaerisporangium fuscum TaxID=2835868 RepID=UPI001BDC2CFC|nr:hypothetical protein [Sphaerisporangium fuscum]
MRRRRARLLAAAPVTSAATSQHLPSPARVVVRHGRSALAARAGVQDAERRGSGRTVMSADGRALTLAQPLETAGRRLRRTH